MDSYKVRVGGSNQPARTTLNIIAGNGASITGGDDEANGETEVTIGLQDAGTLSKIFVYDFSVLGGGTGAKTLVDEDGAASTLPDNAVITGVFLEGITTLTSGGAATVALGITGDDTLFRGATAYSDGSFAGDVVTNLAVVGKTSAAVSVLATIAGAALTAGAFRVYVDYKLGA